MLRLRKRSGQSVSIAVKLHRCYPTVGMLDFEHPRHSFSPDNIIRPREMRSTMLSCQLVQPVDELRYYPATSDNLTWMRLVRVRKAGNPCFFVPRVKSIWSNVAEVSAS